MVIKLFIYFFTVIFTFILFKIPPAYTQTLMWAKSIGGIYDDETSQIILDQSGNIYITGSIKGKVDFDSGPDSSIYTSDEWISFFAKYDNDGNFLWVKLFETELQVYGTATDNEGSLYLAGSVNGNIDFDPSVDTAYLLNNNIGGSHIFFAKYDSNGNYIWAKNFNEYGGSGNEATSVAVDNQENVYVAGYFADTVDFDAGIGEVILNTDPSSFTDDMFITKYNKDGKYIWAKNIGGTLGHDGANDIRVDEEGNFIVVGYALDDYDTNTVIKVDFDPSPDSAFIVSQSSFQFVAKYDSACNYLWARNFLDLFAGASQISLNNSGNIFICGQISGTSVFFPDADSIIITNKEYNYNNFLIKLEANGNLAWLRILTHNNFGVTNAIHLSADLNDNILLYGTFNYDLIFEPLYDTLYGVGGNDLFIAKYDGEGNLTWVKNLGGKSNENNGGYGSRTVTLKDDYIYLTGSFEGIVSFDSTNYMLTSIGGADFFLAKYNHYPLGIIDNNNAISENTILVYPNPFNQKAIISFFIDKPSPNSNISVFDVTGKMVKSFKLSESNNNITVSANDFNSGIYFCKLVINGIPQMDGKMIVVK